MRSDLRSVASKDGLAREMSDFFVHLKGNLVGPDEFDEITKKLNPRLRDLAGMYSAYSDYLLERNWVGPGDSIARAVAALRNDPRLSEGLRSGFKHILVDEFQEVDPAQFSLLQALAREETSLFLVGDEDQRIYSFRGSMANQFSKIAESRRGVERISLKKNYRLPPGIESVANSLMLLNRDGPETESNDRPCDGGAQIKTRRYSDAIEQAYDVARDIKRRVIDNDGDDEGLKYSDFLVVCRSTSQSARPVEEAFAFYDVPYVLYNSTSFYKHPMVRCIAALIRLLIDPGDEVLLQRVLGIPDLGVDPIELSRFKKSLRRAPGDNLFESLKRAARSGEGIAEPTAAALRKFFDYFEKTRKRALETDCPSGLVHSIMEDLFFGKILRNTDISAAMRDAGSLRLLCEVVGDIEGVFGQMRDGCSLANVAEHMEHAFAHFSSQQENDSADEPAGGVAIMTVHQAKGMEFPFVYLIDMTEEYFPRFVRNTTLLDEASAAGLTGALGEYEKTGGIQNLASRIMPSAGERLKEERRLAYVALTRARNDLFVCFPEESNLSEPVQASPFIGELPGANLVEELPRSADSRNESYDARSRLAMALNRDEIEGVLRECAGDIRSDAKENAKLAEAIESLGLDSSFICSEYPFEPEPERAIDLSNHVYSASQLSAYLTCPRRFYYEKLMRLSPERPEDFGLGQIVHKAIERFHRRVHSFSGTVEALAEEMGRVFQKIWNGDGDGNRQDALASIFPTALQRATMELRAREILDRYVRTEIEQCADREILECEKHISFDIGGFKFVARIDRIDSSAEGHHIIDHKTSSGGSMKPRTIKKKFINVDDTADYVPQDFQLPIYLLAAGSQGLDPVELAYYWLARPDAKGLFKKGSVRVNEEGVDSLTSEEIRSAEQSIVAVVKDIAAGKFEPRPISRHECSRCVFGEICNKDEGDADGG